MTALPLAKENSLLMKVEVVDYRPEWAQLFATEKTLLSDALGQPDATIEHIGSTSVPGLAAKPVIDIMIGLPDFSLANSFVPHIVALGYDYIAKYEEIMPERRYFRKLVEDRHTRHIHMVEIGSEFWQRHLLFRDYLRTNAQAVQEYADLKKSLAMREWQDRNEYTDAKTEFIKNTEQQAAAALKQRNL